MTEPAATNVPSLFTRLRQPAALNYLVMTAAGLLVYAMIMMSKGNDAGALIAIMLALPGVLARWHGAPVLVLLLTTYLSIDPGFLGLVGSVTGTPWFFPREAGGFFIDDVILAAALLAYTIGHFRLTSIVHQSIPEDLTVRTDSDPRLPPRRPVELVTQDELPKTLVVASACVIAGQAGWLILVLIERLGRPRPSQFTVGTSRFLLVVWLTGLALMVISAALVYMRAAGMTRQEAAMSLRDEFFQENRRETDRLQRWRKWFKERMAMRRRSGK
jgi:hypothetical protein